MRRFAELKELVKKFLELIGEDPERPELRETPERVARMWLEELTVGYSLNPDEQVKTFSVNHVGYGRFGSFVVVSNVPVRSICEHHLLPFYGYAHIAYIPSNEVLGLSKFVRVVNVFSRRLQLQERLTEEIADFLESRLKPKGLALMVEALHTCALVRGVEEPLTMSTVTFRGVLAEDTSLRREALELLNVRKVDLTNYVRYSQHSYR
ncbi:MAG: hypothetical protein B7O98_08235 [Zestosphaera tikiterensis]|uniref:GTP cyclohydrolase 1 n=1 Tax=Zestosphaera tikiterensis TaxID=1973259 RepID=A0A2R7Y2Q0_9CREN|nr:MAG: hypothetical protein B7O98_08235 [Zestosphaera tikiterensis]